MIAVKRQVHFVRRERGRRTMASSPRPARLVRPGRTPRVARLMALAIRYDRMLREGVVESISDLARLAHVTQPRMSQLMNLNLLAPDIQEDILHLPPVTKGRERIHERGLRHIVAVVDWAEQRRAWSNLPKTLNDGAKAVSLA